MNPGGTRREDLDGVDLRSGTRRPSATSGLARLELKVLFEELTRRMPDLALAGEVERRSSTWATSLTAMPVFSPRERAAV